MDLASADMTSHSSPDAAPAQKRNLKAIASIVCAVVAIVAPFPLFLGGIAILLGRQGWKEIEESSGAQSGLMLAKIGTVLGGMVVVFVIGGLVLALFGSGG